MAWAAVLVLGAAGVSTSLPPASEAAALRCGGHQATIIGTGGDDQLTGTAGRDVILGLGGDDSIRALRGSDIVCAGSGADSVEGQRGADLVLGQGDSDILLGGPGQDVLDGGGGMDALAGMGGKDDLRGGGSIDLAAYLTAPGPVTADLSRRVATGEGRDRLDAVEGLIGSSYSDDLRGDGGLNVFFGSGGDDSIVGRVGDDWVFYGLSSGGVAVDLALGTATGGEGDDGLSSVENVVGSPYDDTLLGSAAGNYLDGGAGTDVADGRDGDNLCYAEQTASCYVDIPTSSTEPGDASGGSGTGSGLKSALRGVAGTRPVEAPPEWSPDAPAAGAPDRSRAAYDYVSCPMLQGVAWFNLPRWDGYGYYAYRAYRPFTGYDDWTYSLWLWYGNNGWQVYFQGTWYQVPQTYAVIPGGTSLPVEVYYYWDGTGQWYSMGGCNTNAPAFGVYVS